MNATSNDTVAQLVKIWENKNAQRALRGAGLSTMALSLAACGSDSAEETPVEVTPVVTPLASHPLAIGADAVTGTDGDDTIVALRVDGTLNTWGSSDSIDAGAGTDTLTAVLSATTITPEAGSVAGVENLVLTANGAVTINFTTAAGADRISGVTHVTNIGSTNTLDLDGVQGLFEITINDTNQATTIDFVTGAIDGSADTLTINLNGSTGGLVIEEANVANTGDIEALVVTTSGAASTLDASAFDVDIATVTVSGSGDISFSANDVFDDIATFDGSAATGAITVLFDADTVTGATNTKTITTGSGNDTIDISEIAAATVGAVSVDAGSGNDTVVLGAQGASDYTIAGGAGTDSLSIAINAEAATHMGVSGFERLISTGAGLTQDMVQFIGSNAFTILRAAEDTDFTNVGAAVASLELTTNVTGTVQVDRLVDGAADSIAVATIAASLSLATLDLADEETVTISSANGDLTVTTGVTATDMTSLTVSGDNAVDLSTVTGAAVATVDVSGLTQTAGFIGDFTSAAAMTVTANTAASGYTGVLDISTGSGADTVTGTANNDIIDTNAGNDTISGGAGNDTIDAGTGDDTIDGGAGDDTIIGNAGIDTMTGGAGADVFAFITGETGVTVATADVITDFVSGTDDLDLSAVAGEATVADGGAVVNFAALVVLADANFAGTAGAGDDIYISYNALGTGDAYVFVDENADDAFGAGDTLIVLSGINLATEIVAATDIV